MDRKEAIEIVRKNWPDGRHQLSEALETLIPELKESEDERMREMAIKAVQAPQAQDCIKSWGINPDDVVVWLEKQGSPNLANSAKTCKVEPKSAEKVEAKQNSDIEKGKWYVCDTSRYADFAVGKAYFCPKNGMLKPNENEMARYVAKNCFHLWTIQDAKIGYEQAQQDLMEKFKMWVAHNGYTAKDAEAVYNDFKQFITEN